MFFPDYRFRRGDDMMDDYRQNILSAIECDLTAYERMFTAAGASRTDSRTDRLGAQLEEPEEALQRAAVLVPIIEYEKGPHILLTRRADHLSKHSGQVAFPGGKIEDSDATPIITALREAKEEIGLAADYVETVGLMERMVTGTGFVILPVVAFIRPGFDLQIDRGEVADVFEVPLQFLMDQKNHQIKQYHYKKKSYQYYEIPYQGYRIWGATAGMLRRLSERAFYAKTCSA